MKQSDKDLPTAEDVKGIIPLTELTKPTPAQIEAAAKAMYFEDSRPFVNRRCIDEAWNEEGIMEKRVFIKAAKAALTAAAEIKLHDAGCKAVYTKDEGDCDCAIAAAAEGAMVNPRCLAHGCQLTSAAEVGEPKPGPANTENFHYKEYEKAIAAATIERCAQTADEYEKRAEDGLWGHMDKPGSPADMAECIAAAIRKLKEGK